MAARSVRDFGTLNYERCLTILRGRGSCPLGHNTSLTKWEDVVYVVYHRTEILAYHPDGAIIADCRGFRTNTTKDRLNYLTSAHVHKKKFVWYVGLLEFYDGMNLGNPRNEKEAVEKSAMGGDKVAMKALQDMTKEMAL